jgi:hypothetical protein
MWPISSTKATGDDLLCREIERRLAQYRQQQPLSGHDRLPAVKISVVIPCFNERATIEQVVCAVRASSVEDIELIIVDDGSTMELPTFCGSASPCSLIRSSIARATREKAPHYAWASPPRPATSL